MPLHHRLFPSPALKIQPVLQYVPHYTDVVHDTMVAVGSPRCQNARVIYINSRAQKEVKSFYSATRWSLSWAPPYHEWFRRLTLPSSTLVRVLQPLSFAMCAKTLTRAHVRRAPIPCILTHVLCSIFLCTWTGLGKRLCELLCRSQWTMLPGRVGQVTAVDVLTPTSKSYSLRPVYKR